MNRAMMTMAVLGSLERQRQADHVQRVLERSLSQISAHRPAWWRWTVALAGAITVERIREGL